MKGEEQAQKDVRREQNESHLQNEHETEKEKVSDRLWHKHSVLGPLKWKSNFEKPHRVYGEKSKQKKRGQNWPASWEYSHRWAVEKKALQILRARRETMIFNYQLLCSQFQTRGKKRNGSKEKEVEPASWKKWGKKDRRLLNRKWDRWKDWLMVKKRRAGKNW